MESIHADIIHYFERLDPAQIDQRERHFRPDTPCSVGAHLAHVMGLGPSKELVFKDTGATETEMGPEAFAGADAYARLIGGNRAHAILLLRSCGAPHDPFVFPWEVSPADVFRRAAQIDDLPELTGADLSHTILSGADLRGADFSHTNLGEALLSGADVTGADFSYADLSHAKVRLTDMSKAILVGTDLAGVDLTGSSLPIGDLVQRLMGNAVSWGIIVGLLIGVATGSVIVGLLVGAAIFWVLAKLIDS